MHTYLSRSVATLKHFQESFQFETFADTLGVGLVGANDRRRMLNVKGSRTPVRRRRLEFFTLSSLKTTTTPSPGRLEKCTLIGHKGGHNLIEILDEFKNYARLLDRDQECPCLQLSCGVDV